MEIERLFRMREGLFFFFFWQVLRECVYFFIYVSNLTLESIVLLSFSVAFKHGISSNRFTYIYIYR